MEDLEKAIDEEIATVVKGGITREVIATTRELAGKAEVTFPYETLAVVCNKRMYTSEGEMH